MATENGRGGITRPSHPLLSIVIPAYNEAGCIDEMVRRLTTVVGGLDVDYEIIFVNRLHRHGTRYGLERSNCSGDDGARADAPRHRRG